MGEYLFWKENRRGRVTPLCRVNLKTDIQARIWAGLRLSPIFPGHTLYLRTVDGRWVGKREHGCDRWSPV